MKLLCFKCLDKIPEDSYNYKKDKSDTFYDFLANFCEISRNF